MTSIAFSTLPLSALLAMTPEGLAWLGEEERERISTLNHPRRREQYLAGHWLARCLLAEAEGGEPLAWSLRRSESGAPLAFFRGRRSALHLSLSHTSGQVACAVAGVAVGIDIEQPRRERDYLALAESLYDSAFHAELHGCDEAQRRTAFFRRWTLDEARAKSTGEGLRMHALRKHAWVPTQESRAAGWTWDLDAGWLALALADDAHTVPVRFEIQGDAAAQTPRQWRIEPRE
ncbi:MAG: 4'-phosphopantetheinyl transferase superfamily protein [Lysobacteraceae bacterium]